MKTTLVMSIFFLTCIMMGSVQKAMATSNDTGIIIPLYSYPGPEWDKIIHEKKTHPSIPLVAIINPDNGPGIKSQDYTIGINDLQSSGIVVLGYVYTGSTDLSTVTTQINNYRNWYHVNGIFFDQMYNEKGHESYYRFLSEYVKLLGMNMTVGNPGVDTIPSYIGTVDNIVIHDDPGLPSIVSLGGWHTNYTKSNFSIISYNVNSINETFLSDATRYVKFLYISDATDQNPFDSLPSYLDKLLGNLTKSQNSDSKIAITVKAKSIQGKPIYGLWTIEKSDNNSSSGFTPFSFPAVPANPYTITISNFKNYTFDHWDNNFTNNSRTMVPLQNMTLVAYFKTDNHTASGINDVSNSVLSSTQKSDNETLYTGEESAPLSINIYYMTGDRAGYYSTSLRIYQDFSKKPFEEIGAIEDNPYTITLPLRHNYKIEVYVNGMFASVNYIYLTGAKQSLDFKIPLPGGMRITAVYNDNTTPIVGATVSILSKDNETWATGVTDSNGQILRDWIEPTVIPDDYYIATIKIGQLSYSYFPIHLQPGYGQEIKVTTPWPPIIDSLITVKVYNNQSKTVSKEDGNFIVDLYDANQNKVMNSAVNNRGEAYFYNLKVGDYTFIIINQDNGTKIAQKNVTLDGNKLNFTMKS